MAYYDTYRDQLASLLRGHALWEPDPSGLYDQVQVGDVGYVREGHFLRLFNAVLSADDDAQVHGVPEGFVPLNIGPANIRTLNLFKGDYCSSTVTVEVNHGARFQAADPLADQGTNTSFKCRRRCEGAFLSLPFDGVKKDVIRTRRFEAYIHQHCDSWLEFAIANDHDVRLEDIILVTGCDLTSSWAMAAFVNPSNLEMSLGVRVSEAGIASFQWAVTNQPHHNEPNENVLKSHCVFLRGFRAKRILPFFKTSLKAAAEPRPDNPDNEPGSSIELLREPAVPDYRDPLIGVLDYIAERHPNQNLAIAHEDCLKVVKGVDILTADAVENFLHQNNFPVRTEAGVALLAGDDEGIQEKKITFYAQATVDDKPLHLTIHPALMRYPKIEIASQPLDHDFGLPTIEFLSSAVHPPVHILVLENERLPQNIEVLASDKEIGVTVKDVLNAIFVDLRKFLSWPELAALDEDTRREVEDAFKDRARTEESTSGIQRIDYLRGRNGLQVFPKHPCPEEDDEISRTLPLSRTSDLLVVDADGKTRNTSIAPQPLIRDSLIRSLFSGCLSLFYRVLNPNGRIRLLDVEEGRSQGTISAPPTPIMDPDIEEGKPPGTSIDPTKSPTVKRRALLVGISYAHTQSETWWPLENSHEDVDMFRDLLIGTYGYSPEDITILKDGPDFSDHCQPTRANMIRELKRLVADAASGDKFIFFYSGHSDQQKSFDGRFVEEDGQDEVIITSDIQCILDNELNDIIVKPLPDGNFLLAVFDTCHSGTMLDLPHHHCNNVYVPWQSKGQRVTMTMRNNNPPSPRLRIDTKLEESTEDRQTNKRCRSMGSESHPAREGRPRSSGSFLSQTRFESPVSNVCDGWCRYNPFARRTALSLSACSDPQRAWEGPRGSLTTVLCRYLKKHPRSSYHNLMSHINFALHENSRDLHTYTRQRKKDGCNFDGELDNFQEPKLSSLWKLNMDEIFQL